jgi:carbon storage regulator
VLILSRKRSESIQIGPNIRIIVTDVGKVSVRLGITAPKDVKVLRSELVRDSEAAELRQLEEDRKECRW